VKVKTFAIFFIALFTVFVLLGQLPADGRLWNSSACWGISFILSSILAIIFFLQRISVLPSLLEFADRIDARRSQTIAGETARESDKSRDGEKSLTPEQEPDAE
jgi:hypothetical protein